MGDIQGKKVGIGIPTYGRYDGASNLVGAILKLGIKVDELVVGIDSYSANNDDKLREYLDGVGVRYITNNPRLGTIPNDNMLWHELYERGCDYIIQIEDDNEPLESDAIDSLVEAINASGYELMTLRCPYDLRHMEPQNISWHIENINGIDFSLSKNIGRPWDWFHVRTEICIITRKCIETIGYMDNSLGPYYGPGHPDYTYRAKRAEIYPKDWYISPINAMTKFKFDLCGLSNCSDAEIASSWTRIPEIYGERPLYISYDNATRK